MNANNRIQRNFIYSISFMKWKVERRLSTLLQSALETATAVNNFGNSASENDFLKLCEKVSDIETMIEVTENSFPDFRKNVNIIKREKLSRLKKTSKEAIKGKSKNTRHKRGGIVDQKVEPVKQKTFFQKLFNR